ncbi:hypothetical protein YK48G_12770 [Lentilactobacillus fungorum]|uniref:DUF4430 domain-containing protein n=1 Tax=Lentilactobacillus fungorum TaxID=2201250 RepID=A0ABQ3VY66_9LACO|nr:DUF5776 domain-containing protein [Lentilactobacillus fungorum]GHP13852.1 hypothetical protein YK48G_12770 [Lentilactobacillus fungorum]
MEKKHFVYWLALIMGVFLFIAGGHNSVKADLTTDVDQAITTGVTTIANKENTIDAWDATALAMSENGISDTQIQAAYHTITTNNDYLSGGDEGLNGVSNVAAINGLKAIGKDPTNVANKNLVTQVINDANDPASPYSLVNDPEALSTDNYGQASEAAKTTLIAKLIANQDPKTGIWNQFDKVDYTGRAILALAMNPNQPGASTAMQKAITGVIDNFYQKNGGFADKSGTFGAENAYNDATMTDALAAAGVDVYSPLNDQADYKSPVQRLLDQNVTAANQSAMLIQQATYTFEQARFTKDGGQGSIFSYAQNQPFKPGELARLNTAATNKKQAINNDSQATADSKSAAIQTVNQILATYIGKINADTTNSAATADRQAGISAINAVVVPQPTTNNTPTGTITSTTSNAISATSSSTPSASKAATSVSQPTATPVKKPVSAKGTVVYALTTVKLYKSTHFTKAALIKTYPKRTRVNRPMFLVIGQATNQQNKPIYKVKDLKTGRTGYALSGAKYFKKAYYSANVTKVKVISPKGINEYGKVRLTNNKQHVKKHVQLAVKKVVNYGRTTRLLLTNGNYISGNKKLVFATRISTKKASGQPAPAATSSSTPTAPTSTSTSTSTPATTNPTSTTTTNSTAPATPTAPITPVVPVVPTNTETVTVSVSANGTTLANGSVTVSKGATALDALEALAAKNGLNVTTTGSGSTAYVTGINGYNAGKPGTMTGWLYAVNGGEPGVSMGVYIVKDGDTISLLYNK